MYTYIYISFSGGMKIHKSQAFWWPFTVGWGLPSFPSLQRPGFNTQAFWKTWEGEYGHSRFTGTGAAKGTRYDKMMGTCGKSGFRTCSKLQRTRCFHIFPCFETPRRQDLMRRNV